MHCVNISHRGASALAVTVVYPLHLIHSNNNLAAAHKAALSYHRRPANRLPSESNGNGVQPQNRGVKTPIAVFAAFYVARRLSGVTIHIRLQFRCMWRKNNQVIYHGAKSVTNRRSGRPQRCEDFYSDRIA
jgi:hypothetical protein